MKDEELVIRTTFATILAMGLMMILLNLMFLVIMVVMYLIDTYIF